MKKEEMISGLPCDAGLLIPHRPPMLLVSRLIEKADEEDDDSWSLVEAVAPAAGPFVEGGNLLPEYTIEVLAQAIAASDGYPRLEGKKPTTGLLTGIDNFSWTGSIRPGDRLQIRMRKIFGFGAAFIFQGNVHCGHHLVGEGQLKIWKVEE